MRLFLNRVTAKNSNKMVLENEVCGSDFEEIIPKISKKIASHSHIVC